MPEIQIFDILSEYKVLLTFQFILEKTIDFLLLMLNRVENHVFHFCQLSTV